MCIVAKRYIWREKDNENLCVKIIAGSVQEHEKFVENIMNADSVLSCSCEYLYEIDLAKMCNQEMIKKEAKNDEA